MVFFFTTFPWRIFKSGIHRARVCTLCYNTRTYLVLCVCKTRCTSPTCARIIMIMNSVCFWKMFFFSTRSLTRKNIHFIFKRNLIFIISTWDRVFNVIAIHLGNIRWLILIESFTISYRIMWKIQMVYNFSIYVCTIIMTYR